MKISKRDALQWFEFFAQLDDGDCLPPRQHELALATLAQIEAAVDAKIDAMLVEIPGLKSLNGVNGDGSH